MVAHLKLSQKGLVLLSVPAIFQIIFVVILFLLLKQADYQRVRSENTKAIVTGATDLIRSFYEVFSAVGVYGISKNPEMGERIDNTLDDISLQFKTIRQLSLDRPQEKAVLDKAEVAAAKAIELLHEAKEGIDAGASIRFFRGPLWRERLTAVSKSLFKQLQELVDAEKIEELKSPKAELDTQRFVDRWLFAGVVANIVTVLILAFYFNRDTTNRLKVLMDNTKRLVQKQPLKEALQGEDEIAQLDRTFHSMAEELAAAERIKRQFVATISHDLRTPLTGMQLSLALLLEDSYGKLEQSAKEAIGVLQNDAKRLINLINQLLEVEKLEAGKVKLHCDYIPFSAVIEQSLQSVSTLAEQRHITINAGKTDVLVFADEERIIRVLINLVSNAIKFSPEHATVSVDCEELPDYLKIKVSDEGPGIPEHARDTIFEAYEQVSDNRGDQAQGTGLGLTICKAIVQQHGGDIGVGSGSGKGSAFWFTLPKKEK
jgi:signal transduction histidine kinase